MNRKRKVIKHEMTPARLAALEKARACRKLAYSPKVGPASARKALILSGGSKRAQEAYQAYYGAIEEGDFSKLNARRIQKLAAHDLLHDACLDELSKDGVLIREVVTDSRGNIVGHKKTENPAFAMAMKSAELLGIDASEQGLTVRSRGESSRDQAQEKYFSATRLLVESMAAHVMPDLNRRPAIETTIVSEEE